ncbi:hypothetical protein [Microcystis phage Mae-Yong924-2]|nr:hypothetical protein [Microcystis phage Mea-Yong924-1]QYC50741.1 hypothetical protein [Microcystis phage Mae-Yong924-2]
MALIKTTEQLKKYLGNVASTFEIENIEPIINTIEQDVLVREYLGSALYNALSAANNDGTINNAGNAYLKALLPFAARLVAYMGMFEYGQELIVSIQSNGLNVSKSEKMEAARMWQVNKLEERLERGAMSAAEALFTFLWENADQYPQWVASDQYLELSEGIIATAEEFTKHYSIGRSRLVFSRLKPVMIECQQLYLASAISNAYMEELVEKLRDEDLNADDKAVLLLLRKSLANYTIAQGLATQVIYLGSIGVTVRTFAKSELTSRQENTPSEKRIEALIKHCKTSAEKWRSQALQLLNGNPLDYPTFAASSAYAPTNPAGNLAPVQNEAHGFFRTH